VGARGSVAHVEQLALGVRIPDRATFASYLPGENDEALVALERLVASGTGFCWLSGPQASGKTHLLQAVTVAAGEHRRASYASLRELLPLGPGALDGLSDLAAIALDDLDAIAGRREWEQALFHVYREAEERGAITVLASRLSPVALSWSLPDFASRAIAMHSFVLKPLDESHRAQALRLRAQLRGVDLPDETLRWLERRFPRDMGSLFTLLDTLDAAALVAQRRLTVPFIRSVLRE